MSHVVSIDVKISDLTALEQACATLGLELVRGQKNFKWFGRWVNDYNAKDAAYRQGIDPKDYGKCDHVVRVKGNKQAYEVGLVLDKATGTYKLVFDFWSGGYGLEAAVGKDCQKLTAEYGKCAARIQAKKLASQYGYGVTETYCEATGETTLTLRRY